MNRLTDTARRLTGRSADVAERLDGLDQAVAASKGRVDQSLVDEATAVADRARDRLTLSADHTIAALGGATGSGKSSLFNALCGLDLAAVGVKRPTTSWALACTWGEDGAEELLEWLEIPKRHQVGRLSLLDETPADRDLHGLMLLDLPDHDSTEVSHHLEVQRLVVLADLLVWVLDPQKYADAAVHDRFLRPLHDHEDSMLVLLNHVDEIAPEAVDRCVADIKRLLVDDGLAGVPVLATSATRGDGLGDLRAMLAKRVAAKNMARERLTADIRSVAAKIAEQTGDSEPADPATVGRSELLAACADAAGVPVVVQAVEKASLARARSATGWPLTKWLWRLRPDPIKRLHLDELGTSKATVDAIVPRSSMPEATPVQQARVDAAVRGVVDHTVSGMARPWADSVRNASVARLDDFGDALDEAVVRTDLGISKDTWWWRGTRLLQWLLFLAAVAGALWLLALAAGSFLQLGDQSTPHVAGTPVPTALLIGGVLLGILVAIGCRFGARSSAHKRAGRAEQRLRASLEAATDELVIVPMRAEVDAYRSARDGLRRAMAK